MYVIILSITVKLIKCDICFFIKNMKKLTVVEWIKIIPISPSIDKYLTYFFLKDCLYTPHRRKLFLLLEIHENMKEINKL